MSEFAAWLLGNVFWWLMGVFLGFWAGYLLGTWNTYDELEDGDSCDE